MRWRRERAGGAPGQAGGSALPPGTLPARAASALGPHTASDIADRKDLVTAIRARRREYQRVCAAVGVELNGDIPLGGDLPPGDTAPAAALDALADALERLLVHGLADAPMRPGDPATLIGPAGDLVTARRRVARATRRPGRLGLALALLALCQEGAGRHAEADATAIDAIRRAGEWHLDDHPEVLPTVVLALRSQVSARTALDDARGTLEPLTLAVDLLRSLGRDDAGYHDELVATADRLAGAYLRLDRTADAERVLATIPPRPPDRPPAPEPPPAEPLPPAGRPPTQERPTQEQPAQEQPAPGSADGHATPEGPVTSSGNGSAPVTAPGRSTPPPGGSIPPAAPAPPASADPSGPNGADRPDPPPPDGGNPYQAADAAYLRGRELGASDPATAARLLADAVRGYRALVAVPPSGEPGWVARHRLSVGLWSLATVLGPRLDRWGEAIAAGEEGVELGRDLVAEVSADSPDRDQLVADLAIALSDLAQLYRGAGLPGRSEPTLLEAWETCSAGPGERSRIALGSCLHNLATVRRDGFLVRRRDGAATVPDLQAVVTLAHDAVRVRRPLLSQRRPAGHFELAGSLNLLAGLLLIGGLGAEAAELLTEAQELLDLIGGPMVDHLRTEVDEQHRAARELSQT